MAGERSGSSSSSGWSASSSPSGRASCPTKFADAENNESTSYLPGRRRVDQGADGDRGAAGRRARPGGDRLPPRVRPDRRRTARRSSEDVAQMTKKRFPGVVPTARRAAEGGGRSGRAGAPGGCQRLRAARRRTIPGQPPGYAPFVGPVCSQDGKAAIVTAYIKGNGEGDTILDPVDYWRDTVSDPGRRARGQDHRRRRLLRRRDRGLRGHQRHAAAGGGQPRDRPADPDLPLADLPVHPARRRCIFAETALALARLRPLRARRDDQRRSRARSCRCSCSAPAPTTRC